MSRRARYFWALAVVVTLLVGSEVALDLWRGPRAYVEFENAGAEPVEGLVLTWTTSRMEVGRVAPGASVRVLFAGRDAGPLVARFNQKGNALGACEVAGFCPAALGREGFKQVLRVRTNEVERFQDDSEPTTLLGRLFWGFWDRVRGALESDDASP